MAYSIEIIRERDLWNKSLMRCCNFNVFGLFEWGEYKKKSWNVERIAIYKNGSFQGATQVLLKKYPGVIFGWASCGIFVTDYKHLEKILEQIKTYYSNKAKLYYLRFNFCEETKGDLSFLMSSFSLLKKCNHRVNSGYTVRFLLDSSFDVVKSMSSNNRYYYKKAISKNLRFVLEPNVDASAFTLIHNKMTQSKELGSIQIDQNEITELSMALGDKLKMYTVFKDGERMSSCLLICSENHAYYYLAAACDEGRDVYASFFMVACILKRLSADNISHFDFAGITPYQKNALGVNRFKTGFGGKVVKNIGEWEMSNNQIIVQIFNWLVAKKLG